MDNPPRSGSWSIHTRPEITSKYKILNHVGAGAYSDVYRAIRLYDDLTVALKEIHDYQSAYREIEALQTLSNCPNIVTLMEYFWSEDDDCVLVLEFLGSDLGKVARMGVREGGLGVEEIKGWMVQILRGVDQCHRGNVVHRDLKLENLLVSDSGVLKIADFGQGRILIDHGLVEVDDHQHSEQNISKDTSMTQPPELHDEEDSRNPEPKFNSGDDYLREIDKQTGKEAHFNDGDTSCLATCTTSDRENDPSYSFSPEHIGGYGNHCPLTSCVGTRWFRAPELLYGSINYGPEIDLWSLGCIFAELFSLKPIFPGTSDIDQLSKIINVLGNLTEENWPGCINLPDYRIISFSKVVNPVGIEACLPDRSSDEILLVKKLLCYDPEGRATAMELLNDKYFIEEPLPAPLSELRVPSTNSGEDVDSLDDAREVGSDSDFEDFSGANVETTDSGFSIRFP